MAEKFLLEVWYDTPNGVRLESNIFSSLRGAERAFDMYAGGSTVRIRLRKVNGRIRQTLKIWSRSE